MVKGRQGERIRSSKSSTSILLISSSSLRKLKFSSFFLTFYCFADSMCEELFLDTRGTETKFINFLSGLEAKGVWIFDMGFWFFTGPSRISILVRRWFRSRMWTPRKRWPGTLVSAWRTYTRPRWRRTAATTVAFGARSLGLMVTVASFAPSSSPIFPPNPW